MGDGEAEHFVIDGRRRGVNRRTAQIIVRVSPELKGRALWASRVEGRSLSGLIEGYLVNLVKRVERGDDGICDADGNSDR